MAITAPLCLLALVGGCHPPAPSPKPEARNAVLAESSATLRPDSSPGDKATLRLGTPPTDKKGALSAMEFEVAVGREVHGAETTLKLLSNGEALEREVYEARPTDFRVISAADETFASPIELLRYPVLEGANWKWDGKVVYAGLSRNGHADIAISRHGEDIRSEVTLFVITDSPRPEIKRTLSFWFRRGKGVVARAYGDISSRHPVGEPWQP